MNPYNFTERVRRALQAARQEAVALRHEYVGTEHMLLGLTHDADGIAGAVLRDAGVGAEVVRTSLLQVVRPGVTTPVGPDLPYTSRAKKALELAMAEARQLRHSYVGTEHILLGLLAEERGIAAQVLRSLGLEVGPVREAIVRLLGGTAPAEPAPGPPRDRGQSITVVVDHGEGRLEARRFGSSSEAAQFLTQLEF